MNGGKYAGKAILILLAGYNTHIYAVSSIVSLIAYLFTGCNSANDCIGSPLLILHLLHLPHSFAYSFIILTTIFTFAYFTDPFVRLSMAAQTLDI